MRLQYSVEWNWQLSLIRQDARIVFGQDPAQLSVVIGLMRDMRVPGIGRRYRKAGVMAVHETGSQALAPLPGGWSVPDISILLRADITALP